MKILRTLSICTIFLLIAAYSHGATDSAESDFTPWSGYWWPTQYGGLATGILYRGHPAPLEKYDLLKNGSYPGPATQWYLDHQYDPDALAWEGLCGAWAGASVSENIVFYPSVIDKILFHVGDKKGLLTLSHVNDPSIRVNSHPPEVFHSWLLQYIKGQGLAFSAELDPGPEVWNFPVYRYEMDTIDNGASLSVSCKIWYVIDQVHPDFQGTISKTKNYTYTLFKTNSGTITGGEWTGSSVDNHPQQLKLPLAPASDNPYLDYDFIRTIALSRDDELESAETVDLIPGGYPLLLLNEDVYRIGCDPGDTILLRLTKDEEFTEDVSVVVADSENNIVYSELLDEEKDLTLAALSPPYTITISTDNYDAGGLYNLYYDLKKSFEYTNNKLQKGFGWGGFAITNAGESVIDDIYVVGYGKDGLPIDTYVGPFSLGAGQKQNVVTSDFDISLVDADNFIAVKVMAPADLEVVNLFGYLEKNMSSYGPKKSRSRLIIPDSSSRWDFFRSVYWGLYNPGVDDQDVGMQFFAADGEKIDDIIMTLPANRAENYRSDDSPFSVGESKGWVLVESIDSGTIQGYTEWVENGVTKAGVLSSLAVGRNFSVPQVEDSFFWKQSIVLVNVNNSINTITLTLLDGAATAEVQVQLNPHEKKDIAIAALFAGVDSGFLNRSVLTILSEADMSGYVRFATPGDDLYYSFLDESDFSAELVLPHVATDEYWWTGCTLFNPSSAEVEVQVLPYGADGLVLTDLTVTRIIEAKRKDVFTVSDLFKDQASSVSFIRFRVVQGSGLSGMYAFGNNDCSMLSGAVME